MVTSATTVDQPQLESELASLRRQLRARPTEEELEDMRKEWQTSEDLFSQSQK
jgi:hypothetical protein